MGMQVSFSRDEAENGNCTVEPIYDKESNTYSCIIVDKDNADALITANYAPPIATGFVEDSKSAIWFDVGGCQPSQLAKIAWLIRRRICFTCA